MRAADPDSRQLMTKEILLLNLFADPSSFSSMKILLAGILGGIAMFIWTSIAHLAFPLGEAGLRPNLIAGLSHAGM